MTLLEAINQRHSVRSYTEQPIEKEKIQQITVYIKNLNNESGLHMQLVTNEPKAFSSGLASYGKFQNVSNYIALVAKKGDSELEKVGYYGEKVALFLQTLGLNTCWVGLTYKAVKSAFVVGEGEELKLVIACGYGADSGVQHPAKRPLEQYCSVSADMPVWFREAMQAALLAPTAVNQQKFFFTLQSDGRVLAERKFSLIGYTKIDLGIVKLHFEIGAGDHQVVWA